jgi:hypothetical protein
MRRLFRFYCLFSLLILFLEGCKNGPMQPEGPNEYRERVVISYSRINIVCLEDQNNMLQFCYQLYDPDAEEPFSDENTEEDIQGEYRIRSTSVEYLFFGEYCAVIEHVLIHTRPEQPKHMVYVVDSKLHCSYPNRWETPRGIDVQGAYDLELKSNRLYFKMAKK